jgi:hypothetical protein
VTFLVGDGLKIFVRESYLLRGGTMYVTCQLRDRPPPLEGGKTVFVLVQADGFQHAGVLLNPNKQEILLSDILGRRRPEDSGRNCFQ